MTVLRFIAGVFGAALLAVVLWASFTGGATHGGFMDQFGVVTTLPWGIAALADLYVGFVLFSIVIALVERTWVSALLWIAPLFVLGNFWAAFWLVLRLPALARRLRAAAH